MKGRHKLLGENYLGGYIYHMVHCDNLASIIKQRALKSKASLEAHKISFHSIANAEVQDIRNRVFVWDFSSQRYRRLHEYVPFYFATHTPMLWNKYKEGIQDKMIILAVSRSILKEQGVLFTDGNASNQQLSKDAGERVGIIPANASNKNCRRIYRQGNRDLSGPLGTNSNRSNFYSDITFLGQLNWNVINDRWSTHKDKIRLRHAEVFVPDRVSIEQIKGTFVNTPDMVSTVNKLIAKYRLTGHFPAALCKPALFFNEHENM